MEKINASLIFGGKNIKVSQDLPGYERLHSGRGTGTAYQSH
jgi:hypothetical protein